MTTRIANDEQVLNRGQLLHKRGDVMQCLPTLKFAPGSGDKRLHGCVTGNGQTGPGFRNSAFPFLALVFLLSISWSCGRKAPAPAGTPTLEKQPPPIVPPAIIPSEDPSARSADTDPAPESKTKAAPNKLDLGLGSFRAGDYEGAAQLFEDYLQDTANSENRDLALFHLFLSRRLLNNSGRNVRKAEEALRQIMTELPKSSYRDIAEHILSLQAQIESLKSDGKEKEAKIKQLSDELQKLKEIDMQRRPSKPLY